VKDSTMALDELDVSCMESVHDPLPQVAVVQPL
jgi:hypothetical protein